MKSTKKDLKFRHLILFDATCSLCQRAANHIISLDINKSFIFSPLKGKTATNILKEQQETFLKQNSLVLIEDYKIKPKISLQSRALFKIYFYIGGIYKLLGLLAFCPLIFDPFYRFVARHRHKFKEKKNFSLPKDRFIH